MVGIVSYGAYIPRRRIKVEEIANTYGKNAEFIKNELLINEKSVAAYDEDSFTIAFESVQNAIRRCNLDRNRVGAIYCGSESPVYAVKPNASMIGGALGIRNFTSADLEFACKAGTAGMQAAFGLSKAGFIDCAIAIGTDTAQACQGDILEYTASSGAASVIISNRKEECIAELMEMCSVSSDTPDFWRRPNQKYPSHAERFTGAPAYFKHLVPCTKMLLENAKVKIEDVDHFAFHTPNGKFPMRAGEMLNIPKEKLQENLLVSKIGNTYSGASMLVLTSILDKAVPGQTIALVSFGSGAGSDAFLFKVTDKIKRLKKIATTQDYVDDKEYIDYASYCKMGLK